MADFYQNGTITTLHNLGERSTEDLERDLLSFSERRPLGLILPRCIPKSRRQRYLRLLKNWSQCPICRKL